MTARVPGSEICEEIFAVSADCVDVGTVNTFLWKFFWGFGFAELPRDD